jgi:hypothetical protein
MVSNAYLYPFETNLQKPPESVARTMFGRSCGIKYNWIIYINYQGHHLFEAENV